LRLYGLRSVLKDLFPISGEIENVSAAARMWFAELQFVSIDSLFCNVAIYLFWSYWRKPWAPWERPPGRTHRFSSVQSTWMFSSRIGAIRVKNAFQRSFSRSDGNLSPATSAGLYLCVSNE